MRETGPLRKDVSGDPEAAAPYMGMARTLLGKLKHRMAAGGLSQLSHSTELPDGTIISVMSRLGQDTVRIFAPVLPGTPTPRPVETPWTPQGEEWTPQEPQIDQPVMPQPYMWVGARYRWEDYGDVDNSHTMAYTSLQLVVVEPGNNGVLMADNPVVWAGETQASKTTQTIDLNALQSNFNGYASQSPHGVPAGVHNFGLFTSDNNFSTFMFSKNGLRLYSSASAGDLTSATAFTPYDPMAASGAKRFVAPRAAFVTSDYQTWGATHKWDQVCVLDPWEAQGVAPFDPRPSTAWTRQLLARSGVKTGLSGVLAGNYEILIGAFGESRLGTDRSGSVSPYVPGGVGFHYDYDDFREHLTVPWAKPLRVEIEVRLGKLPYTKVQRFTVEVPTYDDFSRTTVPYGSTYDGSGCAYYQGGNPLAMNWYSGAVLVNPQAGSAVLKPGYVSRIFQPAAYNLVTLRSKRYPVDIYYYTLTSTDTALAGQNLFIVMDKQCCSYFQNGLELVTRSAADAQAAAAAAGIAINRVYRYDNSSNTMTDVGGYNGITDFRTMADPLAAASLAQCHFPIFCGSDGSTAPNYWGGVHGQSQCCEDTYFGN